MSTRAECIAAAGQVFADAIDRLNAADPHEAALAAYEPGGPSVEEIEALIRQQRGDAVPLAS